MSTSLLLSCYYGSPDVYSVSRRQSDRRHTHTHTNMSRERFEMAIKCCGVTNEPTLFYTNLASSFFTRHACVSTGPQISRRPCLTPVERRLERRLEHGYSSYPRWQSVRATFANTVQGYRRRPIIKIFHSNLS